MKPELKRAELTEPELRLLIGWYDDAIDETEGCKSPILMLQRDENIARRKDLEKMFDGRTWNKGPGRKPKVKPEPPPPLPMDGNPVLPNNIAITVPPERQAETDAMNHAAAWAIRS
jgi:hypothetical protein